MSMASFVLRWMFRRGDNKRDAGLRTPEGIRRFDDLRYGEDPKWNVLDVYRSKARGQKKDGFASGGSVLFDLFVCRQRKGFVFPRAVIQAQLNRTTRWAKR